MKDIYHYDSIDRDTRVFGVVADPIGHTLSPIVQNAAFQESGINGVYVPFRVPTEHLDQFLQDCRFMEVAGLSVTIPHKEAVLKACGKADRASQSIGAANTLVFENGQTTAYNTDYRAAMASIDKRLENRASNEPLAGKTALILGAGGAAKAMAAGLHRRGASIIVAGRTRSRADSLAGRVGGRAVDWENRYYVKADLVINCTPLGMHPNVDETPFDMHHLRPNAIVFDTVYNPEQTMFVKEARQRNCQTISGVDMFIGQAALQFKHFTGQDPPVDVMRQHFKRAIGAAKF